MNLDEWRKTQERDLLRWAEQLNELPRPEDLEPRRIQEYPQMISKSEKLKQVCKLQADRIRTRVESIEDEHMKDIEEEQVVIRKGSVSSLPVIKKKFSSADKRERELRTRLSDHHEYQNLKDELKVWETFAQDWRSHISRLHREFRLREVEWQANGGSGMDI